MIVSNEKSINDTWHFTINSLIRSGCTQNNRFFRDQPAIITLDAPTIEACDPKFPISQTELDVINHYIVTGEDEELVVHEWTKLYHHRLFDEPNSQIEYILSQLDADFPRSSCHASLWEKTIDQNSNVKPCTLVVWARIKAGRLDLHIHAHSSDAYGKLILNLQEFVALHHYLGQRAGRPLGRYLHFIDSCHLLERDVPVLIEKGFLG